MAETSQCQRDDRLDKKTFQGLVAYAEPSDPVARARSEQTCSERITEKLASCDNVLVVLRKIPTDNGRILATADDSPCIELKLEHSRIGTLVVHLASKRVRVMVMVPMVMMIRCGNWRGALLHRPYCLCWVRGDWNCSGSR
jgi:hypothetical protein